MTSYSGKRRTDELTLSQVAAELVAAADQIQRQIVAPRTLGSGQSLLEEIEDAQDLVDRLRALAEAEEDESC